MIRDILTPDRIALNVPCATWRDAVRACGNLLVAAGDVEPPFIDSMIAVVEEMGPYMILLPEIAMFHGRPGPAVHRPCLSLATLAAPVAFDEFEGQIIKCAFGFGAVDNVSHIDLLTGLAQLLQNEEFVALLRNNGAREDILRILAGD